LKHYIENDVDKAVGHGEDLLKRDELMKGISNYNAHDLLYTLATAHSLEGTQNMRAIEIYEKALDIVDKHNEETVAEMVINRGYSMNNMGIVKFWEFMNQTQNPEDPEVKAKLPEIVKLLEGAMKDLKGSIRSFEEFDI
jgi:hypothetical protein